MCFEFMEFQGNPLNQSTEGPERCEAELLGVPIFWGVGRGGDHKEGAHLCFFLLA